MVRLLTSVVSLTSLFAVLASASPAPQTPQNLCNGNAENPDPLNGEHCIVPPNPSGGPPIPPLTDDDKKQGVLKLSPTFAKDAITCENVEALGLEYNTTKTECQWAAQRACDHFADTADGKNRGQWISVTAASTQTQNEYCFVAFNIPASSGPSDLARCRQQIMQPIVDNCVQDHGPNTHGTLNLNADGSFVDGNYVAIVLRGVPSPTAKLPDGTCVNPNSKPDASGNCAAPTSKLIKKDIYPRGHPDHYSYIVKYHGMEG
ncbi:MAG: hypothetical protein M1835_005065 [Candelina submexicana]|nr:MAG: hypothetical protein M1835_005065 [Candelina submexicana]